jgi:hypothetical protein
MQHSNPITASTNDFIFLIFMFLYGYTNWENHALPKDDKKGVHTPLLYLLVNQVCEVQLDKR